MSPSSHNHREPIVAADVEKQARGERAGEQSLYTCPDCGGALWQLDDEPIASFACHTGHRCTADRLVVSMSRVLTQAVAEAVRLLNEKSILLRQLAARTNPESYATARLVEQAEQDLEHARLLRTHLLGEAAEDPASIDTTADVIAEVMRELRRPSDD